MATLRHELTIESSTLLSVTNHILDFLIERRSERTYLVETDIFLNYIEEILKCIKSFVNQKISKSSTLSDVSISSILRDYDALEIIIGHIYRLVRQVCDADTLSIPFPIISYINNIMYHFPKETCVYKAKILLLATNELNFIHRRLDELRKVCERSNIIPPFPKKIGIIAFLTSVN